MGSAPLLRTTPGRRRLGLLTIGLLLAALALGATNASAATLFGTVSTQRPGLAPPPAGGASVAVFDSSTQAAIALTATGLDGTYSLTVPSGTFDVRFEPAPGDLFEAATVRGVEVGVARKLDVVLVPAGVVRLSGAVSGSDGPVAGASLAWGGASSFSGSDGSFSLAAAPGSHVLLVDGVSEESWLPAAWSVRAGIATEADRTLDVALPATSVLTVRVLGTDDRPVADAGVLVPSYGRDIVLGGDVGTLLSNGGPGGAQLFARTDENGEVRFRVFDGSTPWQGQQGRVEPPDGSGLGVANFAPPAVDGDTTLVVRPPRTVSLSGVVTGSGGAVAGASVVWGSGFDVTGSEGSYALESAPGSHVLLVDGVSSEPWLPVGWSLRSVIAAEADRELDVALPSASVLTVRVLGSDDEPLADAGVLLPVYGRDLALESDVGTLLSANGPGSAQFFAHTDENGEVRFRVFDGSTPWQGQQGRVEPPDGSGYGMTSFSPPAVDGAATLVVRPPRTVSLSGVVSGAGGPVVGASVAWGAGFGLSGSDGSYSVANAPGSFLLRATGASGESWLAAAWELRVGIATDVDRTLDVVLPPASVLTVRVIGSDGAPVADAGVLVPSYGRNVVVGGDGGTLLSNGSPGGGQLFARTDADGEVRFRIFDGSTPWQGQSGRVEPPFGSGYGMTSFSPPTVDGDTTLVVQFAPPLDDTTAPSIACDAPPTGWHADEVAVACTASDGGSGLADSADAAFSLSTSVGDGNEAAAAQTDTRLICDRASNCTTAGSVGPIMVDRAAPVLVYAQTTDGANGWWTSSPARVHVTASDLNVASLACSVDGAARRPPVVSRPTTLATDLAVKGEGRHVVSCTAADTLGHAVTQDEPVLVDLTAPRVPVITTDRVPDLAGNGGWFRDGVTVTVVDVGDPDLADGSLGSGVDPTAVPASRTFATSGSHSVSAVVSDMAGNVSPTARLVVQLDADPPGTTLDCPARVVRVGVRASARWKDRDGESGLATAGTGAIALDTSRAGTYTVQHSATDNVGHSASSSCTYTVV
jgi:hypothetical protein